MTWAYFKEKYYILVGQNKLSHGPYITLLLLVLHEHSAL
jgi:hypothetical protein